MIFSELAEASRIDGAEAQEAKAAGIKLNIPADKNFAERDSKSYRYVVDYFWPVLREVVSQRGTLEEEWRSIQQMTQMKHNEGRRYLGRSDAYLPTYARASLTQQSMLSKGLFPSDEYVDVWDRDQGQTEAAQWVKSYIQYELDCSARIRSFIKPFFAQYVDLGNACLKYWFRKDLTSRGKVKLKGEVPELGMAINSFEGLTVSVPSIFNTYVYPASADGLREMIFIAERTFISRLFIEEMARKKRWLNVDEALSASSMMDDGVVGSPRDVGTLKDKTGLPMPYTAEQNVAVQHKYAWEFWCVMPLPNEAYVDGEEVGAPLSVRVVLLGGIPVLIQRNPFFHQMPPYLFGRQQVQPGSFYGTGAGKMGQSLQYLVNDFFNQANDVGIFTLNPLMVVNPSQISGNLPPMRPGAIIKTRDIKQAFGFERPPVELIQASQNLTQGLVAMLQDVTGAPPVLQGLGAGRQGKTATGMQILQTNASGPLQDQVEDLEETVMVPLMEAAWSLGVQFRGTPIMLQIMGATGGPGEPQLPSQMDIDPEFKMLASSQSANKQMRAQQAMQYNAMVSNPVMLQLLQAQGRTYNPVPLLQRVYNDAMGFRGFEKAFPAAPPPMMPPGMPGQEMSGEPGQMPPGGGPRSTTEQSQYGQQAETAPGEAEDFMDVRQNADDLAATYGSQGAYGGGT